MLAFVIQMIAFIAQSAAAGQQPARAEELHGLTVRALAAIEEKTEGTRQTVSTISDKLLEAALGKAIPEAEAAGLPLGSPRVTRRIADLISVQEAGGTPSANPSPRQRQDAQERSAADLPIPATSEVPELLDKLQQLSEDELSDINHLGADYEKYGGATGRQIGHGYGYVSSPVKLHRLGLVREIRAPWSGEIVYVLAEAGRKAAALLRSDDLPPDILTQAKPERLRLEDERRRRESVLANDPANEIPIEPDN